MRAAAPCAGTPARLQRPQPLARHALSSPMARARPPALISSGGGKFGVQRQRQSPSSCNLSAPAAVAGPSRPLALRCRASSRGDGRPSEQSAVIEPASSDAPALRDVGVGGSGIGATASGTSVVAERSSTPLALAAAPSAAALALSLAALPGVTGFSLAGPWSTIQALSVLAAVIAVHEAGHFAAARSLGVLVSRFCIGFGPTLVSWRAGAGDLEDEEEEEEEEQQQSMAAAATAEPPAAFRWPWQQAPAPAPPPPPPPAPEPTTTSDNNPFTNTLALLARLRAALAGDADAFLAATPPAPPLAAPKPEGPKPWPRGSVEYALCALPLGGYVAFPEPEDAAARERQQQAQQEEEEEDTSSSNRRPEPTYAPDDPDLLANRPVPQRLLVASAGVAANCVFALLTLLAQMLIVGKAEYDYLPGVKVPDVTRGGAAEAAGLKAGDTILRVGSAQLGSGPGQVAAAVSQIKSSTPGQALEVVVLVEGEESSSPATLPSAPALAATTPAQKTKTLMVIPRAAPRPPPASTPEEQMAQLPPSSQIGVSLIANTFVRHTKPDSLPQALSWAWQEFCRLGTSVLSGLKSIVTDFATASQQLSGPVAIVAAGSEIARADAAGLYQFCAVVNINLAAVNALPLPGLDGGFAALLMVEAVRGGKRVSKGLEAGVMAGGLALLTLMGVALVVRDTARLLL